MKIEDLLEIVKNGRNTTFAWTTFMFFDGYIAKIKQSLTKKLQESKVDTASININVLYKLLEQTIASTNNFNIKCKEILDEACLMGSSDFETIEPGIDQVCYIALSNPEYESLLKQLGFIEELDTARKYPWFKNYQKNTALTVRSQLNPEIMIFPSEKLSELETMLPKPHNSQPETQRTFRTF